LFQGSGIRARHLSAQFALANEVAESMSPFPKKIVGVSPRFFGNSHRQKVGVYFLPNKKRGWLRSGRGFAFRLSYKKSSGFPCDFLQIMIGKKYHFLPNPR
jgi:hypothetical protein